MRKLFPGNGMHGADNEKPRYSRGVPGLFGRAHNRDRTGDLILTKDVLCQLSYVSVLHCVQQLHPRAGDGTRTRDIKLGRLALYQLSYSRVVPSYPAGEPAVLQWWGKDSNLRRLAPSDLQSDLVGHLSTPPKIRRPSLNFGES